MEELVDWMRPFHKVTVFAAYASLGLGTLEHAHKACLPGWDLVPAVEGDDRILSRSPWLARWLRTVVTPSLPAVY